MFRVFIYSSLIVLGLIASQSVDLLAYRETLNLITVVCLSYIMLGVGLEFDLDKSRLRDYGWDYVVAGTAAGFPWLLCAGYLYWIDQLSIPEALLLGRFAAPTSAGVLFAMLIAAGLANTWVFRKVRVLAIFDDLDTILFLIPLQAMLIGMQWAFVAVLAFCVLFLGLAYRFLHQIPLPSNRWFLLVYAQIIVMFCAGFEETFHVHLEVLLPAFALGCMLKVREPDDVVTEEDYLYAEEPSIEAGNWFDRIVRGLFLFLVGTSLPPLDFAYFSFEVTILHIMALGTLANLGKCFPIFCYRDQASLRERIAVAVAMFPRGEVGAGVIFMAIAAGISGPAASLASLSLAANLLMTGVFVVIVKYLVIRADP